MLGYMIINEFVVDMKVRQLIELLQECDGTLDVCVSEVELDYPTGTYEKESYTIETFVKDNGEYTDNSGNIRSGSYISLGW